MSQGPKNVKVVMGGDEPKGTADSVAQAQPATEADEERRAKFEAAVKDIMSKHAKLLKKLAE
ncbi:hypothetical protein [Brevundimonas vesicularis]|uniref:hypothetical protein n=1 Tax=Brevundimonas vesicularis TaxID=41276 RepID=UPI0038D43A06